ncbi:MAG: ABC-F family ATP-binding cassette domain-containing protein [Chitinophagaceae bacterium]
MLILQGVDYTHPGRDPLFTDIHFTLNRRDKIALTGNNGSGKSTLLRIMAGELQPSRGLVKTETKPYYVPQLWDRFADATVAQALRVQDKLLALKKILAGDVTETNLQILADDWTIEERCREELAHWQLDGLDWSQPMRTLSGGQKTKVFLAGILIHEPEIILLDEPGNHLDGAGRRLLHELILSTRAALVLVSHDRHLLNLPGLLCELENGGLTMYGGNYDFYREQKAIEQTALYHDLKSAEKAFRKAKEVQRESLERQQKLDARGKKKQEKAGLPTISMHTFRNNAEKSTARVKDIHAEKVNALAAELGQLREALPASGAIRLLFDDAALHKGKVLITARGVNARFNDRLLWKQGLSIQITSGERIAVKGANGSGKTTLIKFFLGALQPAAGTIESTISQAIYIDQDYSLINVRLSVYEQAQRFNPGSLHEHEIKLRLNRFLFDKTAWDKPCRALSGGERMRLLLCCLTIGNQAPDLIVLDEPTNNLDVQNVDILIRALSEYKGTLLVVSHDKYFLEQIGIGRSLMLE